MVFSIGLACRGAVSRPSQVRLEPESAELFQDCIKQLQHGNHEFQDQNNDIHSAHTRLLWFRSTTGWRTFPPPVASQGIPVIF